MFVFFLSCTLFFLSLSVCHASCLESKQGGGDYRGIMNTFYFTLLPNKSIKINKISQDLSVLCFQVCSSMGPCFIPTLLYLTLYAQNSFLVMNMSTEQLNRFSQSQAGTCSRHLQKLKLKVVVVVEMVSLCLIKRILHPHFELDNHTSFPSPSPTPYLLTLSPLRLYDATRVPLDTLALWRALMTP